MNVLVAPDSYKECLSAAAVCAAMRRGIVSVCPDAQVITCPMADGGDGTLDVILDAADGDRQSVLTTDPLGNPIEAAFGYIADSATAFIETAVACGLELVPPDQRNPLLTSTRGAGRLFIEAVNIGSRKIILTIGGSATVDGGTGFARALGYQFLDSQGHEVPEGGHGLLDVARIVFPDQKPWHDIDIVVACDVDNPLLGTTGAAHVFGPQKGADPEMAETLDRALGCLHNILSEQHGIDMATIPSAGAAGGLGGGLTAFCDARLLPGVDIVMDMVDLREAVDGADLVITGEGRTDSQTAHGKVCTGVAREARQAGIPCIVLSGAVSGSLLAFKEVGISAAFSVSPRPQTLEEAYADAENQIVEATANIVALFQAGQ